MNKMFTFFTAPVSAFFYPPVYKDAAKSSPWRGVLYCLYLGGLATIFLMVLAFTKVMPVADAFLEWTKTTMPVLIWTPAGLSLEDGKTTAELVHPKYGKVVLFDMTKTNATEADLGGAYALVTSTRVYLKQAQGRIEERDITGAAMRGGQQPPSKVRIDGTTVGKVYQNLRNMVVFVGGFLFLIFSFPFFLLVNLFYSLAGLLLNLLRKEKAGYGTIFNLTCFATSTSFTLAWLSVLNPGRVLSYPVALNVLINLIFMFFAFKVTDKESETA